MLTQKVPHYINNQLIQKVLPQITYAGHVLPQLMTHHDAGGKTSLVRNTALDQIVVKSNYDLDILAKDQSMYGKAN